MSIQDNIKTIEDDVGLFFEHLKNEAMDPIKEAIASGGKNISADASAVVSVASAVAVAASRVPGTVGMVATDITMFLPFAKNLLALLSGETTATAAAASLAPAPSNAKS